MRIRTWWSGRVWFAPGGSSFCSVADSIFFAFLGEGWCSRILGLFPCRFRAMECFGGAIGFSRDPISFVCVFLYTASGCGSSTLSHRRSCSSPFLRSRQYSASIYRPCGFCGSSCIGIARRLVWSCFVVCFARSWCSFLSPLLFFLWLCG